MRTLVLTEVNKKIVAIFTLLTSLAMPLVALADYYPDTISYEAVIFAVKDIVWVLFGAFAVIMFLWAGILFLSARGEADKIKQARSALLWGVVGVIVGILAFIIVEIIRTRLGV